jgi:hypothetical protein
VAICIQIDPAAASHILEKNKQILSDSQEEWYQDALVDSLENQNQVDKAFELQSERVKETKKGYLRLIRLRIHLKNLGKAKWKDIDEDLSQLSSSSGNGNEVITTAQF